MDSSCGSTSAENQISKNLRVWDQSLREKLFSHSGQTLCGSTRIYSASKAENCCRLWWLSQRLILGCRNRTFVFSKSGHLHVWEIHSAKNKTCLVFRCAAACWIMLCQNINMSDSCTVFSFILSPPGPLNGWQPMVTPADWEVQIETKLTSSFPESPFRNKCVWLNISTWPTTYDIELWEWPKKTWRGNCIAKKIKSESRLSSVPASFAESCPKVPISHSKPLEPLTCHWKPNMCWKVTFKATCNVYQDGSFGKKTWHTWDNQVFSCPRYTVWIQVVVAHLQKIKSARVLLHHLTVTSWNLVRKC